MRSSTATDQLNAYISQFSTEIPLAKSKIVQPSLPIYNDDEIPVREDIPDPVKIQSTSKKSKPTKIIDNPLPIPPVLSFKSFLEHCKQIEITKKTAEFHNESDEISDDSSDLESTTNLNEKNDILLSQYKENAKNSVLLNSARNPNILAPNNQNFSNEFNETFNPKQSILQKSTDLLSNAIKNNQESVSIINFYEENQYTTRKSEKNYKYTPSKLKNTEIQTSPLKILSPTLPNEEKENIKNETASFTESKGKYSKIKNVIDELSEKIKTDTKSNSKANLKESIDFGTQVNFNTENVNKSQKLFNSQIFEAAKDQILRNPVIPLKSIKKPELTMQNLDLMSIQKNLPKPKNKEITVKLNEINIDPVIKKLPEKINAEILTENCLIRKIPILTQEKLFEISLKPLSQLLNKPKIYSMQTMEVISVSSPIKIPIICDAQTRNIKLTTIKEESCEMSRISNTQENLHENISENLLENNKITENIQISAIIKIQYTVRKYIRKKRAQKLLKLTKPKRYKYQPEKENTNKNAQEYEELRTLLKTINMQEITENSSEPLK